MTGLVERSEKTNDGLRSRLFDVLDGVIKGDVKIEQVEAVCALSDQIINSARVELEVREGEEELKRKEALRLAAATSSLKMLISDNEELVNA